LRNYPIVIIGTPGRVADMSLKAILFLQLIPILVFDEVDLMLGPSYFKNIKHIVDLIGRKLQGGRQTVLFSATSMYNIKFIFTGFKWCKKNVFQELFWYKSRKLEQKAVFLEVQPNLVHLKVKINKKLEIEELNRYLLATEANHILVFINNHQRITETIKKFRTKKIEVESLYGKLDGWERKVTINLFRAGKLRMLILSDTIARGLDFSDCKLVINTEMPSSTAEYIHRAGRLGRVNREGAVITFYTKDQEFVIKTWEKGLKTTFIEIKVRNGEILTIKEYIKSTWF